MAYPISCNECRRRKIRCDREDPCKNCNRKSVKCSYPEKFRSINLNQLKANGIDKPEHSSFGERDKASTLKKYERRIKELETKLAISEDLISIFDTNGTSGPNQESPLKCFGSNSLESLEYSVMAGIIDLNKTQRTRKINLQKKYLPALVDDPGENMKFILKLVDAFFDKEECTFFCDLIDENEIREFLNEYDTIVEWCHDEQLMLVQVVVIDVLKTWVDYKDGKPLIPNMSLKLRDAVVQYYQVSKLQPRESLNLVKTQIFLASYYYYVFDFDKAWKLLFQIVSNAFSLGIHLTQGPVWSKIGLLEAILCGVTSRPNILSNYLMKREAINYDEFGEYEFAELLRLKNRIYVENCIEKKPVDFSEVLRMDKKFDVYSSFLKHKLLELKQENDNSNQQLKNEERLRLMLLLLLSFQMNLHYELFETRQPCDCKTMILIDSFMEVLELSIEPGKLHKLRHKFAALECMLYQFLLIFLKYLNFKNVKILIGRGINDSKLPEHIRSLIKHQKAINKIKAENPRYHNVRMIKVMEVIKSINIENFAALNLVPKNFTSATANANFRADTETNGSNTDSAFNTNTISPSISSSDGHSITTPMDILASPNLELETFGTIDSPLKSRTCQGLHGTYSNEEVKNLFEDEGILKALRDISEMLPYPDGKDILRSSLNF